MRIKTTPQQLDALIETIKHADQVRFNSVFERKITTEILKKLLSKLAIRRFSLTKITSVEFDPQTLLCLDMILPQITVDNPLVTAEITILYNQINRLCISI